MIIGKSFLVSPAHAILDLNLNFFFYGGGG
jgi:hypothetical protein